MQRPSSATYVHSRLTSRRSSISLSAILLTSVTAKRRRSRAKSATTNRPSLSSAAKKATNFTPTSSPNPPLISNPADWVLELGHDSLPAVQPLFDTPHWANVGVTNDLAAIPRVIAAERSEKS